MMNVIINLSVIKSKAGIGSTAAALLPILQRYEAASARRGLRDKRGRPFCYASKKHLAEVMGKCVRTITRALQELIRAGLIESQRTTRNAHIFLTDQGHFVLSMTGHDVQSIYKNSDYNNNSTSINQSHNTRDVCNHETTPATISAQDQGQRQQERHAQMNQTNEQPGHTPAKGTPTPKRQPEDYEARRAARERYAQHMAERLHMTDLLWTLPELSDEHDQFQALINIVSDALSMGETINVSQTPIPKSVYWSTVKNLNPRIATDTLEKVNEAEMFGRIKHNRRGYLLSTLYNACQWAHIKGGASACA